MFNGANVSSRFDVAQICLNGHVINQKFQISPIENQVFCHRCGEKTIVACEKCGFSIRGAFVSAGYTKKFDTAPAFCQNCGNQFPWTERAIQASIELMTEDGSLDADEQKQFNESVNEIARDTPKTPLASSRMNRFVLKAGRGTAQALRDILVDVASETAKKIIWPDQTK